MTQYHTPRKRFGQHFLVSPQVIDGVLSAISARAADTVVEIGPGRGAITRGLAATGAEVHAIEFDRDLVPRLHEQFSAFPNVTIHEADALAFDYASLGKDLRIVGNLPYNISTPLMFRMLEVSDCIRDLHFMLQKEVVDRLAASPGSKAYGRLTIMLGCRMHAEPLFEVPPGAFQPPPRVTSAVLRLWPRTDDRPVIDDPALMSRLVAQAFSQRRKTLRNALKGAAEPRDLEQCDINPASRAEEVPVAAWAALANRLARRS